MNNNISILILAARASTRMGKIKQLLPWRKGTLLSNALDTARASTANSVIVVTGANATEIVNHLDQDGVVILKNSDWPSGMGSSIGCGIRYIKDNIPECSAVLLMLADQPLIDASYLDELIGTYKHRGGIVATSYNSGPGVPAIFDRGHFDELQKLNKEYGAKQVLAAHWSATITLDPQGKQKDIDTIEEYNQLIEQSGNHNKQQ